MKNLYESQIVLTSTNTQANNQILPTISNQVLFMVLGAAALLAIAVIVLVVMRKSQKKQREELQKQVTNLDERKNDVLGSTIEAQLVKIRTYEQTDRIQDKYKKWSKEWDEIQATLETNLASKMLGLDDLIETNQFKEFADVKQSVIDFLVVEEKKCEVLENEINTFIINEEKIQKDFDTVKDTLKQAAQLYFANKSSLGEYSDQIKVRIQDLETDLYKIINSDDIEDKALANEHLTKINAKILSEHKLIKELPNSIVLHNKILVPQLTALKKVHQEMIEQNYLFQGLSLDVRIDKLTDRTKEIEESISMFELDMIEQNGAYIRKQIEEIHQIFINEKAAKEDVEKTIEQLNQRMNRLRFDKESFLQEWNDISRRYEITKEQSTQVDVFSAQVLSAETKMILFNNQYEKNEEANVVLLSELKEFVKHLNELDYSLETLKGNLEAVKEDEIYIFAQFKQLKYMHHRSKRKIGQVPVELLPDEYLMKNQEAIDALNEIEKNINQEVLDVNHLTELIETAQHLSIRFYKDTNMIVKAASFAEKAIIYSNRYRFDREVQRDLAKAEYYYHQGEYTDSLDVVLTTLEKVEPGIYETLFEAYEEAVERENQ